MSTKPDEGWYVTETPTDLDASCEATDLKRLTKESLVGVAERIQRRARKQKTP